MFELIDLMPPRSQLRRQFFVSRSTATTRKESTHYSGHNAMKVKTQIPPSSHPMTRENRGCWGQMCHPVGKEFQRKNFGLSHIPVEDFMRSQWQTSTRSYLWLIYRWGLAVCFSVGVLGSLVQQFNEGRWFIYLTDWGFAMCMTTSVFGAILVSIYHINPDRFGADSTAIKIYWLCHWTTLVAAALITFVYWLFIFPNDNASASDTYNLWAHGFNSILMLIDHMLVAFPSRLLHFIYPTCFGVVYATFSLIYYLSGGVDPLGNRFIYEILDWSSPGWALLTVAGCLILILVFTFLMFCLYKLRSKIYGKCMHSKLTLNA